MAQSSPQSRYTVIHNIWYKMHLMQLNCVVCVCVCITIKNLHSERHVNAGFSYNGEREKWLVVCYKSQKLFHFTVQAASLESFYWCFFVWRKEIKHLLSGSSLESAYRTQITPGNTFLLGKPNKQRRDTLARLLESFFFFFWIPPSHLSGNKL